MVYAIILDLEENSKRDFRPLYKKIKSLGAWMHYLDSTWLVAPSNLKMANDIYNELKPFIDEEEDYLLVVEVTRNYQGWLPKEAWDWMNQRSFKL